VIILELEMEITPLKILVSSTNKTKILLVVVINMTLI